MRPEVGVMLGFIVGLIFLALLGLGLIESPQAPPAIPAVEAYEAPPQEPEPTPEPPKIGTVTAYSCGGLTTEAEIEMNCPSLKNYPQGRTSTGTTPQPYRTVACDRANLGREFEIEGVGRVKCEDTGGAIKGAGRFDLYVETVQEAREWGRRTLEYREVL